MRESLQEVLQDLLSQLTSREREVLQMRFGLGDGEPSSLIAVGRSLNISRERACQIQARALFKLRQPQHREVIRDYLFALN